MSAKLSKQADELRKILSLSISEAEMLKKKQKGSTLLEVITINFERLLLPELLDSVEKELESCFFHNKPKAK